MEKKNQKAKKQFLPQNIPISVTLHLVHDYYSQTLNTHFYISTSFVLLEATYVHNSQTDKRVSHL